MDRNTSFESTVYTSFHSTLRSVIYRSARIKDDHKIDLTHGSGGILTLVIAYLKRGREKNEEMWRFVDRRLIN